MKMFPFFKKNQLQQFSPNVLITNFCNQRCPYCFANENMKKSRQQEMSLEDFNKLIKMMHKNKADSLRLLGGEPTLHSKFQELVSLGLDNFREVWIFSNGILSKETHQYIIENKNRELNFIFNLDTPVFAYSEKKRQEVEERVCQFSEFATVYTGFTISDLKRDYLQIYQSFNKETLQKIFIRFSIMKPIIGEKPFFNPFSKEEKKQVGKKVIETVRELKKLQVRAVVVDCGLMKEMFTPKQQEYLQENLEMKGWGCDGYWGGFDIDTDLTAIPCFPHSQIKRISLDEKTVFSQVIEEFSCKEMCFYKTLENKK